MTDGISIRTSNALKAWGITIDEARALSQAELIHIPGIGKTSVIEMRGEWEDYRGPLFHKTGHKRQIEAIKEMKKQKLKLSAIILFPDLVSKTIEKIFNAAASAGISTNDCRKVIIDCVHGEDISKFLRDDEEA